MANISPIFSKIADIQWLPSALTTANTAKDGTGTVGTVFVSDATNGGFVESLECKALGTNVASVLRVFLNNGQTNSVPANNVLFKEVALPATTLSEVIGTLEVSVPMELALPPGYKINVVLGTTVAGGWIISGLGGKY